MVKRTLVQVQVLESPYQVILNQKNDPGHKILTDAKRIFRNVPIQGTDSTEMYESLCSEIFGRSDGAVDLETSSFELITTKGPFGKVIKGVYEGDFFKTITNSVERYYAVTIGIRIIR